MSESPPRQMLPASGGWRQQQSFSQSAEVPSTLGPPSSPSTAGHAKTDSRSRREVEHILSALEAARRSLDLSTDCPGALQPSNGSDAGAAANSPAAVFFSRSALPTPTPPSVGRSVGAQTYGAEQTQMTRASWASTSTSGFYEGPEETGARRRDPMISLAGHNNRYDSHF